MRVFLLQWHRQSWLLSLSPIVFFFSKYFSSYSISALATKSILIGRGLRASTHQSHTLSGTLDDTNYAGTNWRNELDAAAAGSNEDMSVFENNNLFRRRRVLSFMSSSSIMAVGLGGGESCTASALEEPEECQNGRIVSESAVPGAYQQTCMSLDERKFRLDSLPSSSNTITVYQGTNAAGGMAGRTGVAVWNSGILLTRLLDKLNQLHPSSFEQKSIMELGCGAALASIALSKFGTSSVTATDFNSEVLALAERNIERNNGNTGNSNNLRSANVAKTAMLQWGLLDATEYESSMDVIVGSDLTYNSGSWVALAETMSTILKPNGIVIYLTLGHSGFNVGGELGGFLSVAENTGLKLLNKDSDEWREKIGNGISMDGILASIISPEEKAVIDANGGVRVVVLGKKQYGSKR